MRTNCWADVLLDTAENGDPLVALDYAANIGSSVAGLTVWRLEPDSRVRHLASARVDGAFIEAASESFLSPASNPLLRDLPGSPPGRLCHLGSYTDFNGYLNAGVYRELAEPLSVYHAGTLVMPTASGGYLFTLGMRSGNNWLNDAETARTGHRLRQLARALELHTERTLRCAAHCAVDANDEGCNELAGLMLDDRGRTFLLTEPQQRFLGGVPLFRPVSNGGALSPMDKDATDEYLQAFDDARRGKIGRLMMIAGDQTYLVSVRRGPGLRFGETYFLDASLLRRPPWTRRSLRRAYDLTPRESDVTLLLADGRTVAEIAERSGLKERSVRVYLGRAFAKTGTRSQSELVVRLHRQA